MGPCTPSACMGPTCSRGPFRHDEDLPKYFKIGRFRPDPAIDSSGWDPSKKGTDLAAGICAALRPVHKNHVSGLFSLCAWKGIAKINDRGL